MELDCSWLPVTAPLEQQVLRLVGNTPWGFLGPAACKVVRKALRKLIGQPEQISLRHTTGRREGSVVGIAFVDFIELNRMIEIKVVDRCVSPVSFPDV